MRTRFPNLVIVLMSLGALAISLHGVLTGSGNTSKAWIGVVGFSVVLAVLFVVFLWKTGSRHRWRTKRSRRDDQPDSDSRS